MHLLLSVDCHYESILFVCITHIYGVPFVKILYLTDLEQKLASLRIFSYLCGEIAISPWI